jgi:hypothetical protein
MAGDPISPELALIDPALAGHSTREGGPMIDPLEPPRAPEAPANGAGPAHVIPPLETLLYEAGLITADLLGELVRDSVVSGRSVGDVALERGLVSPQVIQALLAHAGELTPPPAEAPAAAEEAPVPTVTLAFIERVDEPVLPSPFVERVEEAAPSAWGHLPVAPDPPEPEAEIASIPEVPAETVLSVVPPSVEVPETAAPAVAARPAYTLMLRLQSGERMIVETATTFDGAVELARNLVGRFTAADEWPLVAGRFIRPETIVSVDVERSLEA